MQDLNALKPADDASSRETGPRPEDDHTQRPSTLRFYGDEFVFDTETGKFFRVTATAAFLLHSLESGVPQDQLVSLMQQRYGVERMTAVRDVELLLNDLSAIGILDRFRR